MDGYGVRSTDTVSCYPCLWVLMLDVCYSWCAYGGDDCSGVNAANGVYGDVAGDIRLVISGESNQYSKPIYRCYLGSRRREMSNIIHNT